MNIKYTKLLGLITLTGTIAGLVMAGILYTVEPILSIPGLLIAAVSGFIFVKFIYHFIKLGPTYVITEEDREEVLDSRKK